MGNSYFGARGCVYVVPGQGSGNAGLYKIDGFPAADPDAPVLLQSVEITDNDIVMPVATMNNFKVVYTFGQDFGNLVIGGEILLGPTGDLAGGLKNLINWFNVNRVSVLLAPVSVSLPGGAAYKAYVQGLQIGRVDPELCTVPFGISAIIAEPGDPAA
jgi:hypothetical protein